MRTNIYIIFFLLFSIIVYGQEDDKEYFTIYGHHKKDTIKGVKHFKKITDTIYIPGFEEHKNIVKYNKKHFNHLIQFESGLYKVNLKNNNLRELFEDISKKNRVGFTLIGNTGVGVTSDLESFSIDFLVDELCYQYGMLAVKELSRFVIYGLGAEKITGDKQVLYHYHPRNIKALSLNEKISNLNVKTELFLDEESNTILVSGKLSDVKATIVKLRSLDVKLKKVSIELLVVAYNHGENFNWGFDLSSGQISRVSNLKYNPSNGIGFDYNFLNNLKPNFKVNLQALVEKQHANIVTNPHLVTLNNKEAKLKISEVRNIVLETSNINGTTTNLEQVDAGIELAVTPKILSNNSLSLEVNVRHSFFLPQQASNVININTQTNNLDTKVMVKNGETLIIGGLIQAEESDGKKGVPILRDIPLLGLLFKGSSKIVNYTETVIYITPYIEPLRNGTIIHSAKQSRTLMKNIREVGEKIQNKGIKRTFKGMKNKK